MAKTSKFDRSGTFSLKPSLLGLWAGCVFASGVGFSTSALAEEWKVYGDVSLDTEYSDNKQLAIIDPDEGLQTIGNVNLNAAKVSRKDQLLVHADFEAVRYSGIELLNDEENYSVRVSGDHKPNRTVVLGWYGEFARDTTSNRLSRLGRQVDENSEFNPDTALTREQFRTTEFSAGPSISYRASRNLTLSANYVYRDVEFPERATTDFNFFDFDRHLVQAQASYAIDERQSLLLATRASKFESSGRFEDDAMNFVVGDVDTDTLGASLGYRFDLSETTYFGVNAGLERIKTNTDFDAFDSNDTEFVYRIFALSRGEQSRVLFSYGRSVQPSGVGRLLESNLARIIYSYKVGPRQSFGLRASYLSNKPIGGVGNSDRLDREFFSLVPSYRYAVNRNFSLGLSYGFRSRELRVEGTEADSHSVSANVKYQFGRD